MKSRHSSLLPYWIALTVLVLSAYGCSASATPTPAPQHTEPQEELTVERDVTFGTGPFVLEDPRVGLSDLPSYTATLTLAFDGTQGGKPAQWTKTYVMLAQKDPAGRQLTLQKTGALPNVEPVFGAEWGGAAYSWQGENTCTAGPIKEGETLGDRLEPAAFLHFVAGAEEAGTDTTNGVAANHYAFDEHALAQEDLTQSKGELWVASDGGFVVKYLLNSKGKADFFGEGIEGTLDMDYELTAVNQPVEISLPADCPPGLVDAPRLEDASNVVSDPGLLTYTTASTIEDAAAFYQQELPKLGWQAAGESSVAEDSALQTFDKDGETLLVSITLENGATNVQVALLPTPEETPG